jgi:ethanolamine-phosphate cytidylyltransferase
MPLAFDPYAVPKALNIYTEIANHDFQNVNAAEIVARIMKGRALYEERQRKKGEKGMTEEVERIRQEMEREQKRREVEGQFGL